MERNRQSVPLRHLHEVRGWAEGRVRGGGDAAWSQYQHMKLIEAIDAILSRNAEAGSELSPSGSTSRLVEESDPRQSDWPVQVLS